MSCSGYIDGAYQGSLVTIHPETQEAELFACSAQQPM